MSHRLVAAGKRDLAASTPTRLPGSVNRRLSQRDQQMRNRHTTVARAAVFCRFLAGLSPASSIDASALLNELLERLYLVGHFLVVCFLLHLLQIRLGHIRPSLTHLAL